MMQRFDNVKGPKTDWNDFRRSIFALGKPWSVENVKFKMTDPQKHPIFAGKKTYWALLKTSKICGNDLFCAFVCRLDDLLFVSCAAQTSSGNCVEKNIFNNWDQVANFFSVRSIAADITQSIDTCPSMFYNVLNSVYNDSHHKDKYVDVKDEITFDTDINTIISKLDERFGSVIQRNKFLREHGFLTGYMSKIKFGVKLDKAKQYLVDIVNADSLDNFPPYNKLKYELTKTDSDKDETVDESSDENNTEIRICKKCGNTIHRDTAKFCDQCGAKLLTEQEEVIVALMSIRSEVQFLPQTHRDEVIAAINGAIQYIEKH